MYIKIKKSLKEIFYYNKILKIILSLIPAFIFGIFTVLISYKLLPHTGIFMLGDAQYFWPHSDFNVFSTWAKSFLGISWIVRMAGSPITGSLPLLLTNIGLSNESASYILNFLPVFLTCLLFFYITKKITKSIYLAYFAGFFVILNNLILEQFIIWPGHYFWNVIGLGILFYQTWQIHRYGSNIKRLILIIICSLFILHPFLWFLYISYFICFTLFQVIVEKSYKFLIYGAVTAVLIFLIHSYWLLLFLYSLINPAENYLGGPNSVYEGYSLIAKYSNFFNLKHYAGFFSPNPQNEVHNIFQTLFNYLFLIISILALAYKKVKKFDLFLFIIFLFYFNLALGPNSIITGKLFLWAFNNIPGFTFFRSFTRFLQISFISLLFMAALAFKDLKIKYKNAIVLFLIFFIIFSNTIFFTGDLNGTLGTAKVPNEYYVINRKYFSDNNFSKYSILTYPNLCYESNTWNINRNIKTFPQITYFKHLFFFHPIIFNMCAVSLNTRNNLFDRLFDYNDQFKFIPAFDNKVNQLNVRYILIQKDLFDILNINDQVKYDKYIAYFNNSRNYELKESNQYFTLYENKDYQSIIFSNNSYFKYIFDTKYEINIKNLISKQPLTFLQNFDDNWKLYLNKNVDKKSCQISKYYKDINTTECQHDNKIFEGEDLTYLWRKNIFNDTHKIVNEYANGWILDPEYIKQNYPQEYYKINPDGSIDIELTLYFKPQSYFYLGLGVSGLVFLVCFVYLGYDWKKRKFRKS